MAFRDLQEPPNREAAADDVDHAEQPERCARAEGVRPIIERDDAEQHGYAINVTLLTAAAVSSSPMKRTTDR